MTFPNANSGLSDKYGFGTQALLLFTRAAVRRGGLMSSLPRLSNATWTHGGWSNLQELLRRGTFFVKRIEGLAENSALLDSGLFEPAGLKQIVATHFSGCTSYHKLLLEFLTISGWLACSPYSGVAYDG